MAALSGLNVVAIASGESHSAAIISNGALYTWGSSMHGQLGHGSHDEIKTPTQVQSLDGMVIMSMALGPDLTAVLDSEGRVLTCGGSYDPSKGVSATLTPIEALTGRPVKSFHCSVYHMLVLLRDGGVFIWRGHDDPELLDAVHFTAQHKHAAVVEVSCGSAHNSVLCTGGELFTWGRDNFGQLGHGGAPAGNLHDGLIPLEAFRHRKVSYAQCGETHTACIVEASN